MKTNKNLFFVITVLIIVLGSIYAGLKDRIGASPEVISSSNESTDINVSDLMASMNIAKFTEKKAAPDFTLNSLDGDTVSLRQYHDNVVLISFWATW